MHEVQAYVKRVRERVDELFGEVPEQLRHVAIEHRLMHAETFAYILHQLPYEQKISTGEPRTGEGAKPAGRFVEVPAGVAQLGMDPSQGFGWDNEFPMQCVSVPAFSAARHKVTNGEYLEFVKQGAPAPFFW